MIRPVKFFSLSLLICLFSMFITIPVLAMPSMPSSFYGMVKVNGNNVPDGTLIEALINNQVYIKSYVQTYQGDSVYALDIPGDDADTAALDGGRDGETIQFRVGGVLANETGIWKSATNVNLNLNLTAAVGDIAEPQSTPSPIPTQTAITIIQASPVPTQIIASIEASPIPTQIPSVQLQPSSVSTTSVLPIEKTAFPAGPSSPPPATIIHSSTPYADSGNNSGNGSTIIAVVTLASVTAGGVLFSMRRKIGIADKSNKSE